MLPIPQLNFGFNDAENYRRKENKELLNQIFVRTEDLDKLCRNNVFFLIGEKGTGKTAYAVYLSNNNYKNTAGSLNYIRETEYQKFISMKEEKHLVTRPDFFESADTFLQFLYELNVICYFELAGNEQFSRWCFRERDPCNFTPKVKINERYGIHPGLGKSLNVGRWLNRRD